jgi:hypothetical protein
VLVASRTNRPQEGLEGHRIPGAISTSAIRSEQPVNDEIHRRLVVAGLAPHDLAALWPDLAGDRARYRVPYDLHPSPAAHDLVARYVLDEILDRE